MKRALAFIAILAAALALAGCTPSNTALPITHVMVVVLENTDEADAVQQAYFQALAARGVLLTNVAAEAHPSQPNYIAMVAGSTYGVTDDSNVTIDVRHIGDLLEGVGKSWKVYAEDYPGNCFLGATSGYYARKHVPFLSFANVTGDPVRCARIVDAAELATDVNNGTLPTYSLYVPNLLNDGHDTGAAYADNWLRTTFEPLLNDKRFTDGMLLIVTFDEAEAGSPAGNVVATILVSTTIEPGVTVSVALSHYSILKLAEDVLGLGSLHAGDATATPITGIWK